MADRYEKMRLNMDKMEDKLIFHGVRCGCCENNEKPPKHAVEKKEYVRPVGAGHEASGTGDDDRRKKDKDDHGGGGGGGGGGGSGSGGGHRVKEKDAIYCPKCKHSFNSWNDYVGHDCKKLQSASTIDGQ